MEGDDAPPHPLKSTGSRYRYTLPNSLQVLGTGTTVILYPIVYRYSVPVYPLYPIGSSSSDESSGYTGCKKN